MIFINHNPHWAYLCLKSFKNFCRIKSKLLKPQRNLLSRYNICLSHTVAHLDLECATCCFFFSESVQILLLCLKCLFRKPVFSEIYSSFEILLTSFTSLVAQMVKNLLAMQETQVQSLYQENSLEKGIATQADILA